jgi:hypothetical protein
MVRRSKGDGREVEGRWKGGGRDMEGGRKEFISKKKIVIILK